jgi:hypothetical protein
MKDFLKFWLLTVMFLSPIIALFNYHLYSLEHANSIKTIFLIDAIALLVTPISTLLVLTLFDKLNGNSDF